MFRQESEVTRTATIVLGGPPRTTLMTSSERSMMASTSSRPSRRILDWCLVQERQRSSSSREYRVSARRTQGLAQYSIKKFGEAFEVVPRTLAESAGLDATEVLSRLYAAHQRKDDWAAGVDMEV